ncbi:MAG: hypothetical protein J2P27_16740 [Actinobacteria bacterium]|nr:hypothetical protein [Actinomycetota bacterium]
MTGVRRWHVGAIVVIGAVFVAACTTAPQSARQSPVLGRTAAQFPQAAASLPSPGQAGALRAESCQRISYGADGSPSPVLCPDGHPNAYAAPALKSAAPQMLSLGQSATLYQVETVECTDLSAGSTKPIEEQAYKYMKALNGWAFAADPTAGGIFYVCLPP